MMDVFRPRENIRPVAAAIYDRLVREQEKRKSNKNWMDEEVVALWEEINKQRSKLGKQPITLNIVMDAEMLAQGHIDYTAKCAYYGDDLVHDRKPSAL